MLLRLLLVARLCASETAMGVGLSPDALKARRAAMPELDRRRSELEGVSSWLLINSMKSERVQFELWCQHCAQVSPPAKRGTALLTLTLTL